MSWLRRRHFRIGRLIYERGAWSWYGPLNCYTYRDRTIIKYSRPNL